MACFTTKKIAYTSLPQNIIFFASSIMNSRIKNLMMNRSFKLSLPDSQLNRSMKTPISEMKTMNAELFTLTYGALVVDLLRDYESEEEVNNQLEKIGYNMGIRIADDLLSKHSNIGRCSDTHQVANVISKHALKYYLGVAAQVSQANLPANEFSLLMDTNPLLEFVDIPEKYDKLCYCQVICGTIRGALEAIHLNATAVMINDFEIRVKIIKVLHEYMPIGDDE